MEHPARGCVSAVIAAWSARFSRRGSVGKDDDILGIDREGDRILGAGRGGGVQLENFDALLAGEFDDVLGHLAEVDRL